MQNLQILQRNSSACKNVKVDDLILMAQEQSPRSQWPLGRVEEVDSKGNIHATNYNNSSFRRNIGCFNVNGPVARGRM